EPVKTKVGIDLKPESGTEAAQFTCGVVPVIWRGSLIEPVAANAMKKLTTLKKTSGLKPERFEGGERDVLEQSSAGGPYEDLESTLTLIQTNEEKIEVSTLH